VIFSDSFESPLVDRNFYSTFTAGQQLGGWTVTAGDVDLIGQDFWQAAEGVQSLDLNGTHPGAIATTLTTVPFLTYRIDFRLAGNPHGPPQVKTGQVRVNNVVVDNFTADTTGHSSADMGYLQRTVLVTTTATSATIEFASTTDLPTGPVIDNIIIQNCLVTTCP
jgi:choice-of-anchor C domain-containing protein